MFDMNDFDNIKKPSEREEAPDYLIEDPNFLNQMMSLTRLIRDTDFDTHQGRTSFIMHVMNMSIDNPELDNDKSLDVVSALASHICMMILAINGNKNAYLNNFDSSIIQPMIDSGPYTPIWDN